MKDNHSPELVSELVSYVLDTEAEDFFDRCLEEFADEDDNPDFVPAPNDGPLAWHVYALARKLDGTFDTLPSDVSRVLRGTPVWQL